MLFPTANRRGGSAGRQSWADAREPGRRAPSRGPSAPRDFGRRAGCEWRQADSGQADESGRGRRHRGRSPRARSSRRRRRGRGAAPSAAVRRCAGRRAAARRPAHGRGGRATTRWVRMLGEAHDGKGPGAAMGRPRRPWPGQAASAAAACSRYAGAPLKAARRVSESASSAPPSSSRRAARRARRRAPHPTPVGDGEPAVVGAPGAPGPSRREAGARQVGALAARPRRRRAARPSSAPGRPASRRQEGADGGQRTGAADDAAPWESARPSKTSIS